MKTTKKLFALLLALAMCMGLTACGGSNTDTTPGEAPANSGPAGSGSDHSAEPSTLVYGSGDYTSINPIMNEHCEIKYLLFDGLMTRGGDGSLVPALAKSQTYDEAAMTYTFKLRDDVKWHDGEPFTADDVKFTIEAIMDPDNGSENAPNYEEIKEIHVLDDYEITFVLSEPNFAFLDYMTMPIMPRHLLQGEDMWESGFFKHPVGTGPYKLESWDFGQSITLVKNEDYFSGSARIDTIIFKIVTDDNAKALQLQSGELDLAQVTPKDAAAFQGSNGFRIYEMKTSDYRGILYNFQNEYWQKNADLIPAISYAIDRQAILDSILLGCGDIAYGPLQRNIYNNEDVEHYDYNPEKAAEVLESVGCEKDAEGFWCRNGERIHFTINATPGDQVRIDMAQAAAQQLQQIGLDVKANVPADGIDWGGQECCIIGWGSPFDADDHTYKVFGTDQAANYSGYSNPLVDQYLIKARQTADTAERVVAYDKFQVELANTPAYTFFCYIDAMYVGVDSITGIAKDTVLGHHGVGIFWNICDWEITK